MLSCARVQAGDCAQVCREHAPALESCARYCEAGKLPLRCIARAVSEGGVVACATSKAIHRTLAKEFAAEPRAAFGRDEPEHGDGGLIGAKVEGEGEGESEGGLGLSAEPKPVCEEPISGVAGLRVSWSATHDAACPFVVATRDVRSAVARCVSAAYRRQRPPKPFSWQFYFVLRDGGEPDLGAYAVTHPDDPEPGRCVQRAIAGASKVSQASGMVTLTVRSAK